MNKPALSRPARILTAAALFLALAGCAASGHVPGGHSTITLPHVTAAPGEHGTAAPKPQLPAWNGDCTAFFTDAQSQAVTGLPTALFPYPDGEYVGSYEAVTALGGGRDCSYSDADSDSEHVGLMIFPATLPGAAVSAPKCENANSGPVQFQDTCSAATVAHGYWLTVDFSPGTTLTYAQAFSAVNSLTASFTAKTSAFAPPVAPPSIPGTWVKTETCDALAAHSAASAAIGYPAFGHAVDPYYDGNGPAFASAQTSVGAIGCQWGSPTGYTSAGKILGFQVYLVPGAGKLNPPAAVPNYATAVSIPGATAAWDTEYNGNDLAHVYVVAGSNYLEFIPDGNVSLSLAAVAPAITKIITTMNAGG